LADGEVKKKAKIQTRIGQKMVNQKDPLWMVIKVILLEMIEESKDVSDVARRVILKETA